MKSVRFALVKLTIEHPDKLKKSEIDEIVRECNHEFRAIAPNTGIVNSEIVSLESMRGIA